MVLERAPIDLTESGLELVAVRARPKLPEWSQNLGITRRCIDSVVEKVLTPPAKVTWSYTYTRLGYAQKRRQLVPENWWTEDVSDLDMDLFQCIITAIRSANTLLPQLIGEALHVYTCRWLPDTTKSLLPETTSASQTEDDVDREKQILETVVSMIPADRGSVSIGFLLRLLSIGNFLGASPITKADLISVRKFSIAVEKATLWRTTGPTREIDSEEALPEIARPDHDDVYKAVNIYLKCSRLPKKLSPEVCAHAVRNERLPLRTVVQVLFFEQERGTSKIPPQELLLGRQRLPLTRGDPPSKLKVTSSEKFREVEEDTTIAGIPERSHHRMAKSDGKLMLGPEQYVSGKEAGQAEEIIDKGRVTH
ncbi:BTB/POZ domain-containing protein [Actinidia chinensis var. chinensis]|uniref:BTB/POZ domain-containing protein n=1 Tax=Actinidia chinensis var. chinensis TaxID=1590841 RepID=A0A2R6QM17_ACTCC|nr:BTB/POZ domain-containing protein [Actinidia chinensis var. chinensis]